MKNNLRISNNLSIKLIIILQYKFISIILIFLYFWKKNFKYTQHLFKLIDIVMLLYIIICTFIFLKRFRDFIKNFYLIYLIKGIFIGTKITIKILSN